MAHASGHKVHVFVRDSGSYVLKPWNVNYYLGARPRHFMDPEIVLSEAQPATITIGTPHPDLTGEDVVRSWCKGTILNLGAPVTLVAGDSDMALYPKSTEAAEEIVIDGDGASTAYQWRNPPNTPNLSLIHI